MPVILATQEAEIRRIVVPSQPGQIVHRFYLEKTHHTHTQKAGEVAAGAGPECKLQCHKKKTKKIIFKPGTNGASL
jgi:hypothetical protein